MRKCRMCTYNKNRLNCVKINNPRTEVNMTIKHIYFDSANIFRSWHWKVFLGIIGVPGKWAGFLRNTCEEVSFLVKLLGEARWQSFSRVLLNFKRYLTSNFRFWEQVFPTKLSGCFGAV